MLCCRTGPLTMAPSAARHLHRAPSPEQERAEYPVPHPAAVARQVRRPAASASRPSRSRPATCGPTSRGYDPHRARPTPARQAGHRAELSGDRRGPTWSRPIALRVTRRLHGPAGARALPPGGVPARAGRRRRCGESGEGRRRHRHHHLPSRRHGEDGPCLRPHGGGGRAPARASASTACASPTPPSCRRSPPATPTRRR